MNGNGEELENLPDEHRPPPPPSDEQPIVVVGVDEDEDAPRRLPEPDLPRGEGGLADAYAALEIRTPPEELEAFARGRVEALARLGQADRAALSQEALRVAQAALRRAMGALPREAP
jgi:hypothetical protein